MHKHLQNEFKYEPINMHQKNLWMHSHVERHELKEFGNGFYGVAILIATLGLMFCMLWAYSEYPKAFKPNTVTVNK